MKEIQSTTAPAETLRGQLGFVVRSPRRVMLAVLGLVCVGLAVAGVFIPGLPTTIFLIAGSYLLTKSCPYLEERLIRNRLFRPYLRYVDGTEPMPRRARISAIAMLWIAVSGSLALLGFRGQLPAWLGAVILAVAVAGTIFIARWRRA